MAYVEGFPGGNNRNNLFLRHDPFYYSHGSVDKDCIQRNIFPKNLDIIPIPISQRLANQNTRLEPFIKTPV